MKFSSVGLCTIVFIQAVGFSLPAKADVAGWTLAISPATPRVLESVYARITNTQTCVVDPHTLRLHQEGSTIRVETRFIPNCISTGPGETVDVLLGAFPAGTYGVSVTDEGNVQVASQQFTVSDSYAAKTSTFPLVNYTDHWWNPQESGWGLSITQHPTDQLFAVWFVYNSSNQPTWYTLQPGQWTTPTRYTGPIFKSTGPFFGGNFDPNQVGVAQVGSGTLSFDSPTSGTFSYMVEGVSGTKTISRLPF